ncbi:MAG: peptide chain release factor 3 [Chlamydia sp.]
MEIITTLNRFSSFNELYMNLSTTSKELSNEITRRRTFAIISHPDAGKTTLTEKLLLYSGMIHTAGMVRGRKGRKAAASDWMSMEQERGISITASAMQFEYENCVINILDTPGHEDFSEDTYRTLTAADCAIMVIDAAKGVEKQTRKLFEVCKLRKVPVLTFINKMDMPGRDPLDLMSEVEDVLQIKSYAYNWPIGTSRNFCGVYDRIDKKALFFTKTAIGGAQRADICYRSIDDPLFSEKLSPDEFTRLHDELSLLSEAGNSFDHEQFLQGEITPVFFASALTNFGIEPFFNAFIHLAPSPGRREVIADTKNGDTQIDPVETPFSAYIFKIQSNMNKKHRDSMAFLRICSGKFERDLTVYHHRLKKEIRLSRPHSMLAGERATVDIGYAGDIIGVINPGIFHIGDTLSLSRGFSFKPLPQFQPEIFARVNSKDVGKRKAFDKGIQQLAEEGAIQILSPFDDNLENIYAVVGRLQIEVMQYRLLDEYGVETSITDLSYQCSAWIKGDLASLKTYSNSILVRDRLLRPMLLFSSLWEKQYAIKQNPDHEFIDISA